ncbi:glycosyltransferase family 2 protein [Psychroserpens luteolus]|uniref:glycosyltransferase family 2 protein n=1 Tax=Psychroserpens luteolus TaxID=2855840 RepID=UPI001E4AA772|nr:glycosyltransferase family 2 protein [Psychroserpens luteolus]MCD2258913.1 glycosyltransferase family 2 protein [Psychroserpens luteolus]
MFSIITPTYNRAHTLNRVYDSLKNQDFKDFYWIIIDDCSTDNTQELVHQWMSSGDINITYHKLNKNQGKSAAVNFGLEYCNQPYTIIADSDDSFSENTLSDLKQLWESISGNENKVASIWTLTKNENGTIVGDKFPQDYWQVNFKERVLNHHIDGEKWACWRTSILSKQKMYTSDKCHIQESHTWNTINKNFDFLCVNIAHRCYFSSEDGLIASKKSKKDLAMVYYYGGYYGLKDVSVSEILKHKYYRNLAFDYFKSRVLFSDKNLKLDSLKSIASGFIFLTRLPKRIVKKLI